ncbi:MAG TPA: SAM-dependent methyltransferase [Acidimicrobiaceae bacterium]|nr:SAM-dependent methyltransferase [Acidimicrobiaceae bacterium]
MDYQRLGLQPGELVLDLGSGPGRHAFETLRRGARVVLCDYDTGELAQARILSSAMAETGEIPSTDAIATTQGDGVYLPFPDDTFDRIIAAEVLEHIPDDEGAIAELHRVLKPGGIIAVTIPAWFPEKICWALSEEYHAPHVPGGHVRIYTENELRRKLRDAGLKPGDAHHAHSLHSPYWWLRCAIDPQHSDDHPLVKAYLKLLTWDIVERPLVTRVADKVLNPVLGKSLIVYARKPESDEVTGRGERSARAAA